MRQQQYESTLVDDLPNVPFHMIGVFCRASELDLPIEKQYEYVRSSAKDYAEQYNREMAAKKDSGRFILNDNDFGDDMVTDYKKFLGKKD